VVVAAARCLAAALSPDYRAYALYPLLARFTWLWFAAYGAAGASLAAGIIAPGLVARRTRASSGAVALAAAVAGAVGIGIALWRATPHAFDGAWDALIPTAPRGGTGIAQCAGWFFGVGLVLSPIAALLNPAFTPRRLKGVLKVVSAASVVLLATLGVVTVLAPPRPLNVLLITFDAQRADHLHCYGYSRDTSPSIDALAARGALFLGANANASWTLPSLASLMTGRLPTDHGATTMDRGLRRSELTLAEALRAAGYDTGGVAASQFAAPEYELSQGFREFVTGRFKDQEKWLADLIDSPPWVTAAAVAFLRERRTRPFFLWMHYYAPHDPYFWRKDHHYLNTAPRDIPLWITHEWLVKNGHRLSAKQVAEIMALYDGRVRNLDDHVARMVAELKRLRLDANTLIILSADHGEEFGQHGYFGHYQLYQDVLHVPLIMAAPGRISVGRRVAAPVQLVDLAPTILDLCGIRYERSRLRGRSLAQLLRGARGYQPVDIVASLTESQGRFEAAKSIRRGRWKLMVLAAPPKAELYDLFVDPGELHDCAGRGLAVERDLLAALSRYTHGGAGRRVTLSEGARERLRALGYLH
jgi:choline-sulfatase